MKKYSSLLIISLIVILMTRVFLLGQDECLEWDNNPSTTELLLDGDVLYTSDSSVLLAGFGYVAAVGSNNAFYVQKFDGEGSLDASFSDDGVATFIPSYPDHTISTGGVIFKSVVETDDGYAFLSSLILKDGENNIHHGVWLKRIGDDGSSLGDSYYFYNSDLSGDVDGADLAYDSSSGFLIVGNYSDGFHSDVWVIKTDLSGDACTIVDGVCNAGGKWAKLFDYSTDSGDMDVSGLSGSQFLTTSGKSIATTSFNGHLGYAISGRLEGTGEYDDNLFILELLNSDGSIRNFYSITLDLEPNSAIINPYFILKHPSEDAYYLGGSFPQATTPFTLKFYENGGAPYTRILNHPMSFSASFVDAILVNDGNLLVIGNGIFTDTSFILEYNSNAYDNTNLLNADVLLWESSYSNQLFDSVDGTGDGYVITGKNSTDYTRFVMRTGLDGLVDCSLSMEKGLISKNFTLSHPYPNPFNPATTISFSIPEFGLTTITAYNINGRKLETLTNEVLSMGNYSLNWDASDYPSGVYLIRMESGDFTQTQKVVLVK